MKAEYKSYNCECTTYAMHRQIVASGNLYLNGKYDVIL